MTAWSMGGMAHSGKTAFSKHEADHEKPEVWSLNHSENMSLLLR